MTGSPAAGDLLTQRPHRQRRTGLHGRIPPVVEASLPSDLAAELEADGVALPGSRVTESRDIANVLSGAMAAGITVLGVSASVVTLVDAGPRVTRRIAERLKKMATSGTPVRIGAGRWPPPSDDVLVIDDDTTVEEIDAWIQAHLD